MITINRIGFRYINVKGRVAVYRINSKAIILVFVLQIIAGTAWYASTPTSFLGRPLLDGVDNHPSVLMVVLFVLSVLAYVLFTASVLAKSHVTTGFGRFFLVVKIWLFAIIPNYVFVSLHLELSKEDSLYMLSYGAVNCLIAAIILPLWQSSRSIFKG